MIKHRHYYVLLFVIYITLVTTTGCTKKDEKTFQKLSDFNDTSIASLTGAIYGEFFDAELDNVENLYFNDMAAMVESVKSSKAAALCSDQPIARMIVASQPDLMIFHELVAEDCYGFAFRQSDPLREQFDEVILRFSEDGTSGKMEALWFSVNENKTLPDLIHIPEYDGSNGVIRFGYDPVLEPMLYIGTGGKIMGYDIDLVQRIAYELNMEVELIPISMGMRIEALKTNMVDIVGSCMSITEERKLTNVPFEERWVWYSSHLIFFHIR